jgi:hypothetical protein
MPPFGAKTFGGGIGQSQRPNNLWVSYPDDAKRNNGCAHFEICL